MAETVSIKEQVRILVQMQERDSKIYALLKEKEELPAEISRLQNIFEDKKAALKSLEEKEKSLAVRRKEEELELAIKEENIRKLNTQLASLKTNKEYQTMLGQIAGLKTDASLLEEEILKMMDGQDALKAEAVGEKTRLAEEENKFKEEKRKIDQRLKEIEWAINDLTAKRSQLIPSLDKHIFSSYERILKGRGGLALVKIKDYSCQGCYIAVTPQVVNEIKMQDKMITCESCARILYLEEDL